MRIKRDCRELYVGWGEMGLRKPSILGGLTPWFNLYRLGKTNGLGHADQHRKFHLLEKDEINFTDCETDNTQKVICPGLRIAACRFPATVVRGVFREAHLFFSIFQDDLVGQTGR